MKSTFGLALAAVPALAGSAPTQKVIVLLKDLKGKVEADMAAEGKAMDTYTDFCDDESKDKNYAIETATNDIAAYKATIEETTGIMAKLAADIEGDGATSGSKSEELESATSVRKAENEDFVAAEKELVDSVDTLARAISVIKREMSFAQGATVNSKSLAKLDSVSAALGAVINAAWIDVDSAKKLTALTQVDSDDELSLKQPQAATYNYENHSGGIVEVLEDMKDKASDSLNGLRRDETKARHAFELIKQSLSDSIAVLGKQIEQAQAASAAAGEKLAKAQGDLASTEENKAADEKYLAQLTSDCSNKAAEWAARQKSAADEVAALTKAQEILGAKFSFLQSSVTKSAGVSGREEVVSMLKKLGRKYNSFGLVQLASAAASDPFVKIRGLIEAMIAKLLKQAQEEADHNEFCTTEIAKSTKKRETKSNRADKIQANIDSAKAALAALRDEVSTLEKEIADIDASQATATKIRSDENAEYKKAKKDYEESIEAVNGAMTVLKEFYQGSSFIQQAPEFGSSKNDAGSGIISILELALEDFSKLLAETESDEAEAVASHEKLSQENAVSKASKQASVKGKTSEIKSVEVALGHHGEDFATVSAELDAVMDYLSKLKPQCENKAMSYEERKAARDAEIAGMKEALQILSADGGESLLQKASHFLQRK